MAKKRGTQRNNRSAEHKREIDDDSFEQLMAESFQPVRSLEIGDEVEATVIGFDGENVFLDVGTRLDGILKRSELQKWQNEELEDGQTFTVFISGRGSGTWLCSTRLGGGEKGDSDKSAPNSAVIMALEDAFNRNLPVEGQVVAVGKGGFNVQVMGLKAFCPISQIDINYCQNPEEHLNKSYTFVIVRFEPEGDNVNIVVSRRELLAHEQEKRVEKLWQQVEEGAVYEGTVNTIRDFGAFVDIGGIEGLLHISEISYERLDKPEDVLTVGQTLDVLVKNVDRQRRKLSLSAKSLLKDPWIAAVKKLRAGGEFQGKVVRMKTFGAFIELFPGVDGMVHISKLGTDRRHQHPKEVLGIGDIVPVRVIEIDEKNRKISLTMEKEEGDFSQDLKRLKKQQDESVKSSPGQMATLVDEAMKDETQPEEKPEEKAEEKPEEKPED